MALAIVEHMRAGFDGIRLAAQQAQAPETSGGLSRIEPHEWWAKIVLVGIADKAALYEQIPEYRESADEATRRLILGLASTSLRNIDSFVVDSIGLRQVVGRPSLVGQQIAAHTAVVESLAEATGKRPLAIESFRHAENLSLEALKGHIAPPYTRQTLRTSRAGEPSERIIEATWRPTTIVNAHHDPAHDRSPRHPIWRIVHGAHAKNPDNTMAYIGVVDMSRLDAGFGESLVADLVREQTGIAIMPDDQGENWSAVRHWQYELPATPEANG